MTFPYRQYHFPSITSTQHIAFEKAALQQLDEWYLYTADFQSAGMGRNAGSVWQAAAGKSILATYCKIFSKTTPDQIKPTLTLQIAIAVAETLQQLGFKPTIKWPNDILLQGKKVAGVMADVKLIEQKSCLLIGIGINANQELSECEQINANTTSMFTESATVYQLQIVLDTLNEKLEQALAESLQLPKIGKFLERYNEEHIIFSPSGQLGHGDNLTAIIHGIDADGALLLHAAGVIRKYTHGKLFKLQL